MHTWIQYLNSEESQLIKNLMQEYDELFFKKGDKLFLTHKIKHIIIATDEQTHLFEEIQISTCAWMRNSESNKRSIGT